MTRVKICSIQELDHALTAAEAGADFVGFNFVPGVRRQLGEEKARHMIQAYRQRHGRDGPKLVGIFVDQPLDVVNRILDDCDLDIAQLSGNEPLSYSRGLGRPVIKAVHVPMGQPRDLVVSTLGPVLAELEDVGILPLLDPDLADSPGGGTGRHFDWAIARELAVCHQFLLAGGLSPENVSQAVLEVRPWGVDVSSGVETEGVKDPVKIKKFVRVGRTSEESR